LARPFACADSVAHYRHDIFLARGENTYKWRKHCATMLSQEEVSRNTLGVPTKGTPSLLL